VSLSAAKHFRLTQPSGPTGRAVDSAGQSKSHFKRAVERGNVVIAEATAREFALSLEEALQLVLLYAAYEPAKLERAALRWFSRYLDEGKDVSLLNAQLALCWLSFEFGTVTRPRSCWPSCRERRHLRCSAGECCFCYIRRQSGEEAGMRRQATIGALLLITVGVVLGATVFRTDIAQATGMTRSVNQGGVTGGSYSFATSCSNTFDIGKHVASGLALHLSSGVFFFALETAGSSSAAFSTVGPANGGPADIVLSFPKAVSFDRVHCVGNGGIAGGGTVGNGK